MDPREMLGIQAGGHQAAAAHPAAAAAAAAAPPSRSHHGSTSSSGVQQALPRELALLKSELRWDASDPVAPAMPIPSREHMMKAKRVKAVSWRLLPIRSSARTARTGGVVDDLDLFSWAKIHNVADYRFARFNKRVRMLDYTDEEYTSYLSDATWSRAETDRLMELAKQYDLRFILIEDRYNQPAVEAELKRVQEKLDTNEHVRPLETLLHKQPLAAEEAKEQAEAHAASSVALAPNVTMSTHPTPVVAAESDSKASVMDTSDSAASASAAAASAASAEATVPTAASAAPSTDVATAAAAASPSAVAALPQPSPAVPVSALMPPARTAPASSRDLIFPHRSVEHLKARFYFIQQTLTSVRNASDPELRKTNPLFTHPYDAAHEVVRKAQLERLYQRTAVETDAMAEMVLEHRRVLAAIKKIKKQQKDDRDAARGITKAAATKGRDRSGAAAADRNKQRAGAAPPIVPKRPIAPIVGELAPIPPSCDASSVLPVRPPGVYLRSSQLAAPLNLSSRQQKFLEGELSNLNVRRVRDATVATGVVCDMWDRLRVNVLTLANLQQYVREREVMRDDLRAHSSSAPAMAAAAAAAAAAGGVGMSNSAAQYQAAQSQAAAAAMRKKAEKRKLEGADTAESEADKRARKGK